MTTRGLGLQTHYPSRGHKLVIQSSYFSGREYGDSLILMSEGLVDVHVCLESI